MVISEFLLMMETNLFHLLYFGGLVATAVGTFLTTKHRLKEYTKEKVDELKKELHDQKIEINDLKNKNENQEKIVEEFKANVLEHLPRLFDLVDKNKHKRDSNDDREQ